MEKEFSKVNLKNTMESGKVNNINNNNNNIYHNYINNNKIYKNKLDDNKNWFGLQ